MIVLALLFLVGAGWGEVHQHGGGWCRDVGGRPSIDDRCRVPTKPPVPGPTSVETATRFGVDFASVRTPQEPKP